ncbi:redoxin domain-containing protein [Thiosulfativibrio zosterae]|uniref:Thioredoxin domain-containing protein n=1 Tax=Thiosulfativibrio zosterae TaxID=2675053 RepID=A0A6F8PPE0_9GAMM|nr:redoxin domain-containing protein [Thiosulfativibrio zosterae]BBP43860.1 hypothetical protein THMIRHAT_16060 [Thiosulfativibrio zosterae]
MLKFWGVLWLIWMGFAAAFASADEIQLTQFKVENPKALVLWLPSERGVLPQEKALAQALEQQQISVWMPDLFESYFLPIAPSSLLKVPVADVTELIAQFQKQQPSLPHYLITSNRGATLALKALAAKPKSQNLGLIFLNPNLYISTPEPGKLAEYWPEVSRVNYPIYIRQAELAPSRWHLQALQEQLNMRGSDVFIQLLPKLRDRYYFRADANAYEQDRAQFLAADLMQSMRLLNPYLAEKRFNSAVGQAEIATEIKVPDRKIGLQVYQGLANKPLALPSFEGNMVSLTDLHGKVVLLNFWASWCPPCVHEMPSMANLKTQLNQKPFEILAVNLAEERAVIKQFKQQHPLNFPVLMDLQGQAVQDWQVFAYPSSYLIDKQGKIRYALFGSYDWQNPQALNIINELIHE